MAGLFKKALGLFVEFEEESASQGTPQQSSPRISTAATPGKVPANHTFDAGEIDKFEKHFEKMFDQANLPGPDYYEFWKTMETLEAHIPDEKARISATYASLSIQGLTKEKLVETASKYKELIQVDKANFEKVVNEKSEKEVGHKKKEVLTLEEKIAQHSAMIQKLTKEISESQQIISKLKGEITEEENKLNKNKNGYYVACEAMINKITTDVQKIQSTI
jgi:hypothetical protein